MIAIHPNRANGMDHILGVKMERRRNGCASCADVTDMLSRLQQIGAGLFVDLGTCSRQITGRGLAVFTIASTRILVIPYTIHLNIEQSAIILGQCGRKCDQKVSSSLWLVSP